MSDPDEPALPDPDKGVYIFSSGRKGSGKSVVCRHWFEDYPYDRVIIDVTHDVARDLRRDDVEYEVIRGGIDMPARLPAARPDHPRTWVYMPDMGDPAAEDEMDRVAGLAIGRGPTLLWCDEFGEQTTGNKTPPNLKRILHHGRHDRISLLIACPRPVDINPLTISQADKVYTFATSNPADRARIADNIGWAPNEFDEVNNEIQRLNSSSRKPYWHSMYDHATNELWIMPPLPVVSHQRRPVGDSAELAAAAELDEIDDSAKADLGRSPARRGGARRGN